MARGRERRIGVSTSVLVIEDSREYGENLLKLLGDAGYSAVAAHDHAHGLRLARSGFDLALLDVRLPDAIGTDSLGTLRSIEPGSEIIVMSGDATIESAMAAVRGGAMAYVLKPIDPEELLR